MNISELECLPSEECLAEIGRFWNVENFHFIRKMENIVYSCERDGGRFFLRLTSSLRRSQEEIRAELEWIDFLQQQKLPVVQVLKNHHGDLSQRVQCNEEFYEACVFQEISGRHPSEEEMVGEKKFLFRLGALIAKMHTATAGYSPKGLWKRENWDDERGFRHACEAANSSKIPFFMERLKECIAWLRSLEISRENYGLIHADLGLLNLFVQDDESISVIDFDDSCYHWFAFDLAFVIYSIALNSHHGEFDREEQNWLENLLKGYRSVREFRETDVELIPGFIEFACLRIFFWIEYHENLSTFRDEALVGVAKTKQWAVDRLNKNSLVPII